LSNSLRMLAAGASSSGNFSLGHDPDDTRGRIGINARHKPTVPGAGPPDTKTASKNAKRRQRAKVRLQLCPLELTNEVCTSTGGLRLEGMMMNVRSGVQNVGFDEWLGLHRPREERTARPARMANRRQHNKLPLLKVTCERLYAGMVPEASRERHIPKGGNGTASMSFWMQYLEMRALKRHRR